MLTENLISGCEGLNRNLMESSLDSWPHSMTQRSSFWHNCLPTAHYQCSFYALLSYSQAESDRDWLKNELMRTISYTSLYIYRCSAPEPPIFLTKPHSKIPICRLATKSALREAVGKSNFRSRRLSIDNKRRSDGKVRH